MASNQVKGSLELLLMGVLQHGPAHGYAIIAALRDRSDGEFDLAEGTIYPGAAPARGVRARSRVRSRWPTAVGGARTR